MPINNPSPDGKITEFFHQLAGTRSQKEIRSIAVKITGIYMVAGVLWILLSDKALSGFMLDIEAMTKLSLMKGWFYVLISGIMLYTLLQLSLNKVSKMEQELICSNEKLKQLAYYDPVTNLYNRTSLYEKLSLCLTKEPDKKRAILSIDMDNFKYINDTIGHYCGDQLIFSIGKRLSTLIGYNRSIFRLGGDEFVILVHDYSSLQDIEELAVSVAQTFKEPFHIEGNVLHVTASTGIALYPIHGADVDELLKCSDIAMYKAKEAGKNRFVFYDELMNQVVNDRVLIERYLRSAIDKNELELYYQPQLDLKTNKISGFEALLRWRSPELGLVSPLRFIKVAEDTHLIISIGEWVLQNACRFMKTMHCRGYKDLSISVNVSILQLLQNDFSKKVLEILEDLGLEPGYLELEITESILMESYDEIKAQLEILRGNGIKIALDDFGQGYSSLSYLKQLPITTLKIDKVFIDSIADEDGSSITGTIVMMGRKMGLSVVAEGVETIEQLEYLARNKCHKVQGYYFSRPLPQTEAEDLLVSRLFKLA